MSHNIQGLPGSSRSNQYGFPFTVDPEKLRARVCVQSEIHGHNKPSLKAAQRKPKERQVLNTVLSGLDQYFIAGTVWSEWEIRATGRFPSSCNHTLVIFT